MTRISAVLVPSWLFLFVFAAPSDMASADEAQDVIKRAMRARTELPSRLNKMVNSVQVMEGQMTGGGSRLPAAVEISARYPDHFRLEVTIKVGGGQKIMYGLDGESGWRSLGGDSERLDSSQLRELLDEVHANRVATLKPLEGPNYQLAIVPGESVRGQKTTGVKVTYPRRPEVRLYFDRKSGHLVKLHFKSKEGGLPVEKEWIFSEYKEFNRIKLPTELSVIYDGQLFAKWEIKDYQFPERIPDEAFARPRN